MPETMTKLEHAPDWIVQLVGEIDSLVFAGAFDRFEPDADLFFGNEHSRGAEEMKAFYRKLHIPMDTKHKIFEVWSGSGRIYVLGQVDVTMKTEDHKQSADPFQWMLYGDSESLDQFTTWRVSAGPMK